MEWACTGDAPPPAADGYAHRVSTPRRAWLVAVVGSVLALVGVAVLLLGPRPDVSFAWYAYAPMSDTFFPTGPLVLDRGRGWAVAVGIVGLVAVGWAAGFLAGRGSQERSRHST